MDSIREWIGIVQEAPDVRSIIGAWIHHGELIVQVADQDQPLVVVARFLVEAPPVSKKTPRVKRADAGKRRSKAGLAKPVLGVSVPLTGESTLEPREFHRF